MSDRPPLEVPAVRVEIISGDIEPTYVKRLDQLERCWTVEITVERKTGKPFATTYLVVTCRGGFEMQRTDVPGMDAYFVGVAFGRAASCGCPDRSIRRGTKEHCKHIYTCNILISGKEKNGTDL